jgi:GNAT superfamily N-acetyltransferase
MQQNYTIAHMSKDEIKLAIDWASKEGWNPGLHDPDCFYLADPNGFFAGKLNGNIIAIGSAVVYDNFFAFCGFYIVDEHYRGQGYGLALTKKRLAYVGQRNAGLDGVSNMLNKYTKLGYKLAHYNARYRGIAFHPDVKVNKAIIPLSEIDFKLIVNYDRQHFPALRTEFLRCWINQPQGTSLGYMRDGKLCGYGVIRVCQHGYKIAPLFADNARIADELFLTLAKYAHGQDFYLDIPENNLHAIALVKRYQLEKVFVTARMYLKEQPLLPIEQIYGITSFELG